MSDVADGKSILLAMCDCGHGIAAHEAWDARACVRCNCSAFRVRPPASGPTPTPTFCEPTGPSTPVTASDLAVGCVHGWPACVAGNPAACEESAIPLPPSSSLGAATVQVHEQQELMGSTENVQPQGLVPSRDVIDAARAFVAAYDALRATELYTTRQHHLATFDRTLAALRAAIAIPEAP